MILERDAHFGNGSYLTALHPSSGEEYISHNNWLCYRRNKMRGVIVIQISVSDENLRRVIDEKNEARDIYLYTGDLYLQQYPWGHGTFEE